MSWRVSRLGDVLTLKRGHDLPDSQRIEGDIPVISSSGVTGRHNEPKANGPGVVTGRYGTLGQVYYVDEDYWPLNTALYVTDFKGNNPRFLAYFLQNVLRDYQSDKAAVPGVDRNVLHELRVRYPELATQEGIVRALSAYDDLIENNRRRMVLLEDAARELYAEWFVRLRFPGHEHTRITNGIPDGWELMPLGNHVKLNYGKALSAENRTEGDCPVYGSSGIVGFHDKSLARSPGIVLGRKGNVGSVYWCSRDYWPIDTVYFIGPDKSTLWLFYSLRHMHFLSTDVAVPGLNRDYAHSRPLMVPTSRILGEFLYVAEPIHKQIGKLEEMNDKLRAARDLLSPRLMSGELVV